MDAEPNTQVLVEGIEAIVASRTCDDACGAALDVLQRALATPRCWLEHADAAGVPRVRLARGLPEGSAALDGCALPWACVDDAQPLRMTADPAAPAGSRAAALAASGVRAATFLPMLQRGAVVGLVALVDDGACALSAAELREAGVIGTLVAMAFERERCVGVRRRLEQELVHAQRMQGVGGLAGGIAHDFNNMLTAMIGYMDLIAVGLPAGAEEQAYVAQALEAAEQASDLTRRLLSFARRRPEAPTSQDLDALVERLAPLVRRVLPENIEIVARPAAEPCWALADPGLVDQIVVNLVLRARDAMPMGGVLAVSTCHEPAAPGAPAFVAIEIEDSGPHLSEASLRMSIEPAVPALREAGGEGLDLAIVARMAREGGGRIEAANAEGGGTRVRVLWPAVRAPQARAAEPGGTPRGSERVVFVEDDAAVRALGKAMLEKLGYAVVAAERADEALRWLEREPGAVHLLLADLVMPGMSGRELAQRAQARRPDLRVLLTSGYAGTPAGPDVAGGFAFLPKPFSIDALGRRVRETLDAPPASGGGASG